MTMVDLLGIIPLTVGGIVADIVSMLIIFAALVIADKIIAHSVDAKRLLIMSVIAFFVAPIVGSLIAGYIAIPFIGYILPLIVWIILGELLIKEADMKTKLKVIIVAFIVYILLSMFVAPYIFTMLPF